ncbi:MAG TPA: amino acid adenylation domain-containing protein, partial [Pedobacter sp.]
MSYISFALHPAQRDVYTDQLINPDSPLYNVGGYIILKGKFDKVKFNEVIKSAPEVFDFFKLRFKLDQPDFLCYYDEDYNAYNLTELDFSTQGNPEEAAKSWMQENFNASFVLTTNKLPFEQHLLKISDSEHWFFGKYHHLITDGYGFIVWVQYIANKYRSLVTNDGLTFSYPRYRDAALTANEYLNSPAYEKDASYWKNKIVSKPEKPLQKKQFRQNGSSGIYKVIFSADEKQLLEKLQLNTNTNLQQLTLAALLIYFGKTTAESEFIFGVPIHKRGSRVLRNIVGMFSGIIPFKGHYQKDEILRNVLANISATQKADYRHYNYPIGEISRQLKGGNSDGYFYDVVVNFEPFNFDQSFGKSLQSSIVRLSNDDERLPLQLTWNGLGTQVLELQVNFNHEYFSAEEAQLFTERIIYIIGQFTAKINDALGSFQILPAKELALLSSFNPTANPYSQNETLIDLIEQQVEKTPQKIAVLTEGAQITYGELNERSNQLAHYLQSKGVKQEALVPVCIERNINMLIAILGILKAGAAYVPVDPEYPKERIDYTLEDTDASFIVSSTLSRGNVSDKREVTIIELDGFDQKGIANQPKTNLKGLTHSSKLAYVIYTSGSTGNPKGVMIEHGNAFSFLKWCHQEFSNSSFETVYATTSICFDLSVFELFYPLTVGKEIRILENGLDIKKYLSKDSSVLINTVPSVVDSLLNENFDLSLAPVINMAGEPIPLHILQRLDTDRTEVRNLYGPTEDTTYSTVYRLKKNAPILIGKPISNSFIYILNQDNELSPIGVSGEICIGGSGLARGYLNQLELTDKKFLIDPINPNSGSKIYKTGDLGRWLPDGNIEYLNRIDYQVKIRGYRIELGEIENALMNHSAVKQAVVLAKEDGAGSKRLVAYVVPVKDLDKEAVLAFLRNRLPHYMIPSLLVELESFPLTLNGKVDRKALPDPDEKDLLQAQYALPTTELERSLSVIWQEILQVERVGINDSFFDLGGHSILAMRVIAAIRTSLQRELSIKELFLYPTIKSLANYLQENTFSVLLPSIEVLPRPEYIPLSFSQERLWFIDQIEGSLHYHLSTALRLRGSLNIQALEFSLSEVVRRHEVLRTVIKEHQGKAYQVIKDTPGTILRIEDFGQNKGDLDSFIQNLINTPFNLSEDTLLRANLFSLNEDEQVLVITMHHIASDAWSMPILVKEIKELYEAFEQGRESSLPVLPLQYADYSIWQRNNLQVSDIQNKLNYWKEKLTGVVPLELPTDFVRPAANSTRGAATEFTISNSLAERLQTLSQMNGATLYMTLLATFKTLLYRYSGQADICVGTSIVGRQHQELEGLVGFFVNTLALRDTVNGDNSFIELLEAVKTTTIEAYANQDVPLEKVVEAVVKERDPGRSPLFQVMLVLQNTPEIPKLSLRKITFTEEPIELTSVKFDLTFFIQETKDGLKGIVHYNTDLYSSSRIEGMMNHYKQLLNSAVDSPNQKIGKLKMLTSDEEARLLETFNVNDVIYPQEKSIIDLFEEAAIKNPDEIAVEFEGNQITYKELNERANRLASYLNSKGIKTESLVPLFAERSLHMIIGVLGILKAGAAYVPIDVDFPKERINYMLADIQASVMLVSKNVKHTLERNNGVELIDLEEDFEEYNPQLVSNSIKPNNLAYVIYTSGSTGQPKGVMIEHRSVVDYVFGLDKKTAITECKSFALVSTLATDLGNTVIYASLLSGGTLHVFTKEAVSNIEGIHSYFNQHKIDCVKIVPSHWKALADNDNLLLPKKLIVFGGEALQASMVDDIRSSGSLCKIVNHYGPTETTIGKLLFEVKGHNRFENTIPIGKPFSNTKVYVLSKELELCPIGVPGQLYITGDGISRGYWNNSDLTKQKFIQNPFDKSGNSLIYATGDLVKVLDDGNILFIGRADDQIKIRGYRIEIGEIESLLQQNELVSQAVVLAKDDKQDNKRLVAYIVPAERFDKEELINDLKGVLPEYMIPSAWIELEQLPLTANGKVDRKALPDPDTTELLTGGYVAPGNEIEEQLAEIWQDVLEEDQIGINDDFFELGGHSLLAVRLVSSVRKRLKIEMSIGDVFDHPTIAAMASKISEQSKASLLPTIETGLRPDYIPLSFGQERLWFIDRFEGSVQYHVPAVLRFTGNLNIGALNHAFHQIIQRHEALRTVILENDGNPYQFIKQVEDWKLNVVQGAQFVDNDRSLYEYINEVIQKPFDLSKDDMIRVHLIELKDDFILIVTLHHIVSDGWSRALLVKELVELYNSYEEQRPAVLPVLPIQYADFSIWQRKHFQKDVLEKKLDYWKQKLEGTATLQLPTDYSRPAVQSNQGASYEFNIESDLAQKLSNLSHKEGATLFMTLMASFNILIQKYSGQQDICVGTPIAGRLQQDVENLIGFFVNTLALRNNVTPETPFNELLQAVKSTTLEAYDNQEVPFEKVVEAVIKERVININPLFQVMLILRNTPEIPELRLGEVVLSPENLSFTTAMLDIQLFLTETINGLEGLIIFNTDIYKEETIANLASHFKNLLRSVVDNPNEKIGSLSMLAEHEYSQLLHEFNNTHVTYSNDVTIVDLIERKVTESPESLAVIFEQEQITYLELNERANHLANYLLELGVKSEMLIPICLERGSQMLISILAVLKTGAAFIPVDPEYPLDRITYMLEDSGASLVISSLQSRSVIQDKSDIKIIIVDGSDRNVIGQRPAINLAKANRPNQLAYVIYTSGSTGKPKGVMIEHTSVINLLESIANNVSFNAASTFLSVTTYSFDICYLELFVPLITGGRVIILPREVTVDGFSLAKSISHFRPTHMQATPSTWQLLLDTGWENQEDIKILIGGEAIKETIKDSLTAIGEVYNVYGPTETTIWSTIKKLSASEKVAIGKPIWNTQVYIIDSSQNLSPVGVPGEICIAGVGLARGYLNQPELTSLKFVSNPLTDGDGRIYKTGDLGRWLPNGELECLGRIDDQVKIRGYRIELGEIETVILKSNLVNQAVVAVKEDKNANKRLIAYVVSADRFDKEEIQSHLRSILPDYMVPTLWVELESLPLTPNGKVDRRALPDPDFSEASTSGYTAPSNFTEQKLAEIWKELLEVQQVGVTDNFFELGGHSLLAMRVISMVRRELDVDIAVKDLFLHPTISELSSHLESKSGVLLLPAISKSERPEFIPLSFGQERLWFINQLEGSTQYHIPVVLSFKGDLNAGALELALQKVVNRHETLRTVIYEKDGQGYQWVLEPGSWKLQTTDKRGADSAAVKEYVEYLIQQPFDLSKDYSLRAELVTLGAEESLLVVTVHHISFDGWSTSILVKEVVKLYQSFAESREAMLPELGVQYADYAIWQRSYLEGEILEKKIAYWKERLDGITPLELPTDFSRPAVQGYKGSTIEFSISQDKKTRLQALSQEYGAT